MDEEFISSFIRHESKSFYVNLYNLNEFGFDLQKECEIIKQYLDNFNSTTNGVQVISLDEIKQNLNSIKQKIKKSNNIIFEEVEKDLFYYSIEKLNTLFSVSNNHSELLNQKKQLNLGDIVKDEIKYYSHFLMEHNQVISLSGQSKTIGSEGLYHLLFSTLIQNSLEHSHDYSSILIKLDNLDSKTKINIENELGAKRKVFGFGEGLGTQFINKFVGQSGVKEIYYKSRINLNPNQNNSGRLETRVPNPIYGIELKL